jgi:transposase
MEAVPRSTLSEAMNRRDPKIFKALFEEMLDRVLKLSPKHPFKFNNPFYAIDSTTIPLCLSVYDWAHYRKEKGAIKLHPQLDLSGNLPCFVRMSNGKMSDIRAAKEHIVIVPDSIYCFDKGYYDLNWFRQIENQDAFFVTRIKDNAKIEFVGQHREPRPQCGILRDEVIWYEARQSIRKYPGELRLIEYRDPATGKTYRFMTNNFKLAAGSIAEIYRQRWQIELFFKWIKQNLKIKSFLGTSPNAVMAQIWVAMIHYLLVAYLQFLHKFNLTLTEITRRIRDTLMQRLSLLEVLSLERKIIEKPPDWNCFDGQQVLFPGFLC